MRPSASFTSFRYSSILPRSFRRRKHRFSSEKGVEEGEKKACHIQSLLETPAVVEAGGEGGGIKKQLIDSSSLCCAGSGLPRNEGRGEKKREKKKRSYNPIPKFAVCYGTKITRALADRNSSHTFGEGGEGRKKGKKKGKVPNLAATVSF